MNVIEDGSIALSKTTEIGWSRPTAMRSGAGVEETTAAGDSCWRLEEDHVDPVVRISVRARWETTASSVSEEPVAPHAGPGERVERTSRHLRVEPSRCGGVSAHGSQVGRNVDLALQHLDRFVEYSFLPAFGALLREARSPSSSPASVQSRPT